MSLTGFMWKKLWSCAMGKREDVPDWAREISLVAAVHCQHWTGYIFNDYEQVLENLKRFVNRWKDAVCSLICPAGKDDITGSMEIIPRMNEWEERKAS